MRYQDNTIYIAFVRKKNGKLSMVFSTLFVYWLKKIYESVRNYQLPLIMGAKKGTIIFFVLEVIQIR